MDGLKHCRSVTKRKKLLSDRASTRGGKEDEATTGVRVPSSRPEYTKLSILGQGTYGVVFRARKPGSQQVIALKKLHLGNVRDGVPSTTIRELTALKNLTPHPNIVELYDFSFRQNRLFSKPRLFLELEYCHHDLRQFSKRFPNRKPPLCIIRKVMADIVKGTAHCHRHRLIHRDLKPSNILIKFHGEADVVKQKMRANDFEPTSIDVKLADFGLARVHYGRGAPLTHEVITLWYRAPEILLGDDNYGPEVDIWSIGCILAEMIAGVPLFNGATEIATLYKMFEFLGTPTEESWPGVTRLDEYKKQWPMWSAHPGRWSQLKPLPDVMPLMWSHITDFLDRTLRLDPSTRNTIEELAQHPLVAGFV